MADGKPSAILAADARRDLRQILLDTRRRWGDPRRSAYRAALTKALGHLADNPRIGPVWSQDPGRVVRSLVVRQHRLLYRIAPDAIRILRIVHVRQAVAEELGHADVASDP